MRKYYAHLTIINSRPDYAGNCYYAFCYDEYESGKTVVAKFNGGPSNVEEAMRYLGHNNVDNFYNCSKTEMKIREFDRYVKDLPYAGCPSHKIAEFIKENLNK